MISATTPVPLLTCAEINGRSLFRMIRVELSVRPGQGRIWVDLESAGYDVAWQRALRHLAAVGRASHALAWDQTDLFVTSRARGLLLDGRSASLPLFVAWVSLLAGTRLPEPFFATGVALDDSSALIPAPREFIQGKLQFADAYVRQTFPDSRQPVWVPAGSDFESGPLSALDVRQVSTLPEATHLILGLPVLSNEGPAASGGPAS